ncbi:Hsp20/alpha crystallin family protein [Gulosibacter chungangensis]|uniref:Hsp20 family protein n=1 Tax=Gulosibacter chungangensis TaxID=979746 RepID=A0A7J5BBI2_9MICO|nr:Hsp20 family protein [Gulosibacter chungangensis]KAB1643503.1 Hsp20 family protein [Gulosibacter chungangensis]
MYLRTDPFREFDRLAQRVFNGPGTPEQPTVMPMDAWRKGDKFYVEFDLPGVKQDSIELDVERNVVTIKAERPALDEDVERLSSERPRGFFTRQLVLGDNLDTERIEANLDEGVLTLEIPVAEAAKPRKIEVGKDGSRKAIAS